jgi:tRNA threonylcarbamoyladenosine biosynthesis protein TsaB
METGKIARNILAIDCAVGPGSVAVLRNDEVLASSEPESNPSRAEQVLSVVRSVITGAGLSLREIDAIAVSTGPGSYSGIRIGLATALGLGNALSIRPLGVSVLDAIALNADGSGKLITAVAVGKRHAAWSGFDLTPEGPELLSQPVLRTDDDFITALKAVGRASLLCCDDLARRIGASIPDGVELIGLRRTIAESIGIFAARHPEKASLYPIYLRDQATKTGTIA